MQNLTTRVFIISSVTFGVIGAVFFVGTAARWNDSVVLWLFATWGISGSVVLSSFALSVARKYLGDDSTHT
ncbi:MAG: hypothetical protein GXP36_04365 [Actinobacteria bacterium]|nr:hypothetical protein [Actinomycetota bacterium]